MGDLISRQAAYETLTEYYHHTTEIQHKALREALAHVPTAQPTEASCWGCNCQKMERLKEQKTFSEMVHLHDAETHEERTETHGVCLDTIDRQAAIDHLKKRLYETALNNMSGDDELYSEIADNRIHVWVNEIPPAQSEHTNSWCIGCKEYDHERKCCPRYNRVIRQTLDEAYAHGEAEAEYRFHKTEKRCDTCRHEKSQWFNRCADCFEYELWEEKT